MGSTKTSPGPLWGHWLCIKSVIDPSYSTASHGKVEVVGEWWWGWKDSKTEKDCLWERVSKGIPEPTRPAHRTSCLSSMVLVTWNLLSTFKTGFHIIICIYSFSWNSLLSVPSWPQLTQPSSRSSLQMGHLLHSLPQSPILLLSPPLAPFIHVFVVCHTMWLLGLDVSNTS